MGLWTLLWGEAELRNGSGKLVENITAKFAKRNPRRALRDPLESDWHGAFVLLLDVVVIVDHSFDAILQKRHVEVDQ